MNDTTQPRHGRRHAWRPALLRSAAAGMASLGLTFMLCHSPGAQTLDRPSISVARIIAAQPSAQVAFPIRVAQAPRDSFARVRGLPRTAALSEGHSIGAGAWAVPLNALPTLTITLPSTAAGRADVQVALVGPDGSVLAETKCVLDIATAVPMSAPAVVREMSSEDRKRAFQLLQKGDDLLSQGLVAPARQIYERAAELGLAQAAMALGATYDAAELNQPHLRNVLPDQAEARRWYERANAMGAAEAAARLQRLGAR